MSRRAMRNRGFIITLLSSTLAEAIYEQRLKSETHNLQIIQACSCSLLLSFYRLSTLFSHTIIDNDRPCFSCPLQGYAFV